MVYFIVTENFYSIVIESIFSKLQLVSMKYL